MAAAGRSRMTGKQTIGELFTVVGEQPGYLDRTGFVQGPQECLGARCRLGRLDLHKHPARSPVDDHEQIAALGLVLHLGQVLHIHVQIAGHIALKSLVRLRTFGWLERVEIAYAMPA